MKRLIIVAMLLGIISGCGYIDRSCASTTGTPSSTCYDGIVYLQFTSGATIKVQPDGTPVTCR